MRAVVIEKPGSVAVREFPALTPGAGEVVIDIYDFAMDHVASIREYESNPDNETYDRSAKWDGKNNAGIAVASGVYFFRLNVEGRISWGKLVVIN